MKIVQVKVNADVVIPENKVVLSTLSKTSTIDDFIIFL